MTKKKKKAKMKIKEAKDKERKTKHLGDLKSKEIALKHHSHVDRSVFSNLINNVMFTIRPASNLALSKNINSVIHYIVNNNSRIGLEFFCAIIVLESTSGVGFFVVVETRLLPINEAVF